MISFTLKGLDNLKIGKLDSDLLRKIVFKHLHTRREEVLVRPGIGEDCAVVNYGDYNCILSTDPITGAASEVGRLAMHINCNDIASNGVEPLGIMLTILAPEGTTIEEIEMLMKQAADESKKLNVEIIGGHTEITSAVNRIVVSATAIGKQPANKLIKTSGAKLDDVLIMTKTAGLEGTGIIAFDKEVELRSFLLQDEIEHGKSMLDNISVIPEGVIGGQHNVTSMHDVTEGGILGAVWEVCEASDVGCEVDYEKISIDHVTQKICNHYEINPLKLISSGTMLITISKLDLEDLINDFKGKGIQYAVIGSIVSGEKLLLKGNEKLRIESPESDELYKVVS